MPLQYTELANQRSFDNMNLNWTIIQSSSGTLPAIYNNVIILIALRDPIIVSW